MTARVISGCTVAATPLSWTVLVPTNSDIDNTATVTVRCNPNTAFTVDINTGLNSPGGSGQRRVRNVTLNAFIKYEVYRNAARSQVWGTGAGQNYSGNSGATGTVVIPAYGRLNSVNSLRAGGYTDTLTVTVNF